MQVIGLVGCGKVATVHAQVLAKREDVRLAFCDRNLSKAQAFGAKWGSTSVYTDLGDMLAVERLHAAYVLTRVESHPAVAGRLLEAGVPTYIEKPITETPQDFRALRAAADSAGVVVYPGFSALALPGVRRAMGIVRSGRYGALVTAHCDFHWSTSDAIPYGSGQHWAYSLRGGILQNLADHPTSIVLNLLDDVQESSSFRRRRADLPNGVDDLMHIALAGRGQLASLTMSLGQGSSRGTLACDLEGATVVADLRTHVTTVTPHPRPPDLRHRTQATLAVAAATGTGAAISAFKRLSGRLPARPEFAAITDNFFSVIAGRAEPMMDLDRAAQVIEILDGVWNRIDGGAWNRDKSNL